MTSGIRAIARIPKDTTNIEIEMNNMTQDDDIQIFTKNGVHLAGTDLTDYVWGVNGINSGSVNSIFVNSANGFSTGAVYNDSNLLNGRNFYDDYQNGDPLSSIAYNGMNIEYGGDGDRDNNGVTSDPGDNNLEILRVDVATEELLVFVVGEGAFTARATWGDIGQSSLQPYTPYRVETQQNAQEMLERLDRAIVTKDTIRADLGAMQNRLSNTITNLSIQAESLMAAESRISDADIALEMTAFVRNQILTQSAVAMLAQANTLPRMALQVIQG